MKNKIVLSACAVLISGLTAFSQSRLVQVQVKGADDWGYANLEGKVVIEPQFKVCFPFGEEGVALALVKRNWAIINMKGEVIKAAVEPLKPRTNPWSGMVDDFAMATWWLPIMVNGEPLTPKAKSRYR